MSSNKTNTIQKKEEEHSPWAVPLAAAMLCTAAGLTMYTRRSASMLKQMETVAKNQAAREASMKTAHAKKN